MPTDFNPRLYARGDASILGVPLVLDHISIHASTREATCSRIWMGTRQSNFNPRLYARGDRSACASSCRRSHFNPRLYARGD